MANNFAALKERAEWVRNVRAAGGRAVIRHGGRKPVFLEEVPVDQRPPVLKAYLQQTAISTRQHLGLDPEAPLSEFQRIAGPHPANLKPSRMIGVDEMKILIGAIAVVLMGAFIACGGDDNSTSTPKASTAATTPTATATTGATTAANAVDVSLQEWSINPSVLTVGSGAVTFNVKNTGPQFKHEFVILKTDLAPADLPKQADRTVDEEGAGVTSPGEIADIPIGDQQTTTIDLTPGKYLFICNLVDQDTNGTELHFTNGMFRAFTVQ